MKFNTPLTVAELAHFLRCPFKGNGSQPVAGANEIHNVVPGDLVFVDHPKYYDKALRSAAGVVLIDQEVSVPEGKSIIISPQPFDDFNKITTHHAPFKAWTTPRGDGFSMGTGSVVFPNVTIGHHVSIGRDTVVHSGAILGDYTTLGDHVVIGPNTVIGHDAFYYKKRREGYHRLHSCGRTAIGDHVEIGALCAIDRGVTGTTVIGKGTKIDNHVHIGHDTAIGSDCLFAAHVGIAGCVTIEDQVILWGQVGVSSDVVIGKGAVVLAQSGVGRHLKGGVTYFGSPAVEARKMWREMAALRQLPTIIKHL